MDFSTIGRVAPPNGRDLFDYAQFVATIVAAVGALWAVYLMMTATRRSRASADWTRVTAKALAPQGIISIVGQITTGSSGFSIKRKRLTVYEGRKKLKRFDLQIPVTHHGRTDPQFEVTLNDTGQVSLVLKLDVRFSDGGRLKEKRDVEVERS